MNKPKSATKEELNEVKEDVKAVEDCIRTLNREMGEVRGELSAIKYLTGGSLFLLVINALIQLIK